MLHLVLYEPEIPPNTGAIMRLAANTGASLHLIEPLGFSLDDRQLRRAGLDYREWADVTTWPDLEAFSAAGIAQRLLTLSTHNPTRYSDAAFVRDDAVLFGPESRGLPASVRDSVPVSQRLTLPMRPDSRSMNLANSAAVVLFEAWRQLGFSGAARPD